jgi:hypothetical protein
LSKTISNASATDFITASGTLQTTEAYVPTLLNGNPFPGVIKVNVQGATSTTGFNEANTAPIKVFMYYDNNPSNLNDKASKEFIETYTFNSFNSGEYTFSKNFVFNADKGKTILITYESALGCVTKTAQIELSAQSVLPVTFRSFTAVRKDDSKVSLSWTTAMEKDNKGFYVQRSTGSGGWKDAGFVFSQADGGNSSSELSYTFTDVNPSKGVSQYRILQVDLNGLGHYSGIRSVGGSQASSRLLLFPNPSSTGAATLLFDGDGNRDVMVADMSGRIVQQHRSITAGSLILRNLPDGFYTVQVRDNTAGTTATEKFVIMKR